MGKTKKELEQEDINKKVQHNMTKIQSEHDEITLLEASSNAAEPIIGFDESVLIELFPERHDPIDTGIKLTTYIMTQILNCMAATGSYSKACTANKISPLQFLRLRTDVKELDELSKLAKKMYAERISATIHNRAIEGWREPVYYMGEVVGYTRKYSDKLILAQAKRFEPEYKEKTEIDHKVSVAGVLVVSNNPQQTTEEWLENAQKVKRIVSDD